jgi:hypothetical protein
LRELSLGLALVGILLLPHPATAGVLCVNLGGTGGCFSTVQAAVDAASRGDEIAVDVGTYQESIVVEERVSIRGMGPTLTIIEATGSSAIETTAAGLDLSALTVRGGTEQGVLVSGKLTLLDCVVEQSGGHGIRNALEAKAYVDITDSTVRDHSGDGLNLFYGSIAGASRARVLRSTLSGNGGSGIHGEGGSGSVYLDDSTVSDNGDGPFFRGRRLRVRGSTITGNASGFLFGGPPSRLQFTSSILANAASGPDLSSLGGNNNVIRSYGYNVFETVGPDMVLTGRSDLDVVGVDPLLGPLQDNGGPTETHALLPGSPANDLVGKKGFCKRPDQTGTSRLPEPCDPGSTETP